MKYRSSIIVALILGVLAIGAFYPKLDIKEKEGLILYATMSYLDQVHFKTMAIDDKFSESVFDNYLSYIDPGKRYLTEADIKELSVHKMQLDDQANARTFEFFDLSIVVMDKSIAKSKKLFLDVIDDEFDYTKEEYIEMDIEKRTFSQDDAQLRDHWRKMIKYDILTRLNKKMEDQEDAQKGVSEDNAEGSDLKKDDTPKSYDQLLQESRDKTEETFTEMFDRLSKLRRSDRFEAYLNSITHIYDPHSDYFNPKEKEDFDIRMGGKLEGIGARLSTDGDYTKVVSIVAGGPAWKGKDLEVDDLIVAVTQEDTETLDITGMRLDDVVQQIRGKKGTIVVLAVKKKDGTIVDITIERDVVQIEETFAKSLLLDYDGVMDNVGYIKLPKFYSSFEKDDGNSCSVDVANEIEKLKSENVSGIILDLRSNGGGSLNDVVDMSGLFIEAGPIVQVKSRMKDPRIYKDPDPTSKYNGPLIVMVNAYSASASEILAAALQDYDRAIIVGSNSTFGKGTVQRFFDLDRAIRGNEHLKPLGQVKMTMQKFFRIDGGSTQLRGVVPDIILPDNFQFIQTGEKEYDGAMEWTEIDPVGFDQEVFKITDKQTLVNRSNKRVMSNESFSMITENARRLKENRDMTLIPLNLKDFDSMYDKREEDAKKFSDIFENKVPGLKASNLNADLKKIQFDDATIETNEDWLENIQTDIYIDETLKIMKDLVGSK